MRRATPRHRAARGACPRQPTYRRTKRRRIFFEPLEDRRVLAALIGVDFDSIANDSPVNWTSNSSGTPPLTLANLVGEDGVATTIDLLVESAGASVQRNHAFFSNPYLPQHTQSLANIDGSISDSTELRFTFSDLASGTGYEIYLIGGGSGSFQTQAVSILGSTLTAFTQLIPASQLWVNDFVGSAQVPLEDYAVFTSPDTNGKITITVTADASSDAVVAALGIREVGPVRERLYAVRGVSGQVPTIYELDPATLQEVNSFPAPAAVSQIGYQGLAVGPSSLFYADDPTNGNGTLYELDLDTGAIIDADQLGCCYDVTGLGYLNGFVYLEDRYQSNKLSAWNPASDTIHSTTNAPVAVHGGLTGAADRNSLFMSSFSGGASRIYEVNPVNGTLIRTIVPTPFSDLLNGGLAYVNGQFLGAPWGNLGTAYRINPDTGATTPVTLPGSGYLSALASDGVPILGAASEIPATSERLYALRLSSALPNVVNIEQIATDGTIVNSFPVPNLNNNVLGEQGLAVGPRSLFYIDGLQGWPHYLYELDPDTGGIIDVDYIDSSGSFSAAAYLNGKVYLEKDFGTILVWDPLADQIERTFSITGSNNYGLAASPAGELFVANGDSRVIRRVDASTGNTLGSYAFPNSQNVLGLGFFDGELLASTTDDPAKVFRLNPASGVVLGEFTIGSSPSAISALGGDGVAPQADAVLTVTIDSSSLGRATIRESAASNSTTATVRRYGGDMSQPLTVYLTSSDTTEATVPPSVVIGAGQPQANFTISAVDDTLLDGTQYAFIDASIEAVPVGTDTSFGASGTVTTGLREFTSVPGVDMALLPDGKFLVLGYPAGSSVNWQLKRFLPNGALDTTFATSGIFTNTISGIQLASLPTSLITLPDGSAIVASQNHRANNLVVEALTKLTPSGQLDASFGSNGIATESIFLDNSHYADLLVEPDGSIVAVRNATQAGGEARIGMVRFSSRGNLVSTSPTILGGGGLHATSIARQADGKILVAGSDGPDFFVARYNTSGTLDASFSGDGKATITPAAGRLSAEATALRVQPDGKILLAGIVELASGSDWALARLQANGSLDTTFSGDGLWTRSIGSSDDELHDLVLQPDGTLLLAGNDGTSDEFVLHRLTADGNDDPSFAGGNLYRSASGINDALIYRAALQRDGKLVVLGGKGSDIQLRRFHSSTSHHARGVIAVQDYERISVAVSPIAISENGGTATGTVTVTNTDRSLPLVVSLGSTDTTEATVPNSVTIPAGQQSASFPVTAVDDSSSDGTVRAYINASSSGYFGQSGWVWVYDDELTPVPIAAAAPLGAILYTGQGSGDIEHPGEVDRFSISLDRSQTLSVVGRSVSALQPTIQIFSPTSALLRAAQSSFPRTSVAAQNATVGTAGTYVIEVSGLNGSVGDYELEVVVNASIEAEHHGGAENDTTPESLDSSFLPLAVWSSRGAVLGHADTLDFANEGFEGGSLDGRWTTSSTTNGRVQVTDSYGAARGSYSLWMDATVTTPSALNEAVLTLDLSGATSATLSFWHTELSDSMTPLPVSFTGSRNGDGIAISQDGLTWHRVFNPPNVSDWQHVSIDLSAAIANAGISFDADFHIKFQQYGGGSGPTFGRGFDEIQVSTTDLNGIDTYSFTLSDGQSASIAFTEFAASGGSVRLYDAARNLLASGSPGVNVAQAIPQFVDSTFNGTADRYYIDVLGPRSDYSLVVTRNMAFDLENNSSPAAPQLLPPVGYALGYIQHTSDSDGDFYGIDVRAGHRVLVDATVLEYGAGTIDNLLDPMVVVRNPSGAIIVTADTPGRELFEFSATEDGIYSVQVLSQNGESGTYRLLAGIIPFDYGDAPDSGPGTGPGNYQTTHGGPSHLVTSILFQEPLVYLGATVDGDTGRLQNTRADADDTDHALPDDEDGLNNAAADLWVTVGSEPTVNVIVTNRHSSIATLSGWIDYDGDGEFENATERAEAVVAPGTNRGVVTLHFPEVPGGFTGTTYARFRLSTDPTARAPIGTASDGEVEDYVATILEPSPAIVGAKARITHNTATGPMLVNRDRFGTSVASLGDLDGDGVNDLAVGAVGDDTGGADRGAVHILFLNSDGTVRQAQRIASQTGGGPILSLNASFGSAVASLGDLDGDGVTDLAVGASDESIGGSERGAVYVLFLNRDGTVKSFQRIAHQAGGGPVLANGDHFGYSVASIGDLDSDGVSDLAVGATGDDTGGPGRGALYVLFMTPSGTVKGFRKVAHQTSGGPSLEDGDFFGTLGSLGDLNDDGIPDIAVGAQLDATGGSDRGAVYVLFMNADGTVQSSNKIAHETNGGPTLADGDGFGHSLAMVGDLNGDGTADLAVGSRWDETGSIASNSRGAFHFLLLNTDGSVQSHRKIAHLTNGGPLLADGDFFAFSLAAIGDLDGDGVIDVAVGAHGDDTAGGSFSDQGAVHILFLQPFLPTLTVAINETAISENGGTATALVTRSNSDDITQPLTVTLASSAPDEATVPATVTIPPNQVSVVFSIAGQDDVLLDGEQTATITASATGFVPGSDSLQISDHETLTLTFDRPSISESGGSTTATVTRSNTDNQQPIVVTFANSDPGEAAVPVTVTIPANQAAVTLTTTGQDDDFQDGTQSVVLAVSSPGYVGLASTLPVTDDDLIVSPRNATEPDVIRIRPADATGSYNVTFGPTAVQSAVTTWPTKFADKSNYQTAGSNQWAYGDDFVAVDVNKTYALNGYARSGDEFGQRFDANNRQSFGFAAYDVDLQPLAVQHMNFVALDSRPVPGDWSWTQYSGLVGVGTQWPLPADAAFIKPVILANQQGLTNNFVEWRGVSVAEVPAGTTLAELAQPIVDLATVTAADQRTQLTLVGAGDYLATAQLVAVDIAERYTLSAWGPNLRHLVERPIAVASLDVDRKEIYPLHVSRYRLAVDTTLAATLHPGDTSLLLTSASGWSNTWGESAQTRSLAWYGYQDSTGHTYPDYTYTRHVAFDFDNGLWSSGAIAYDTTVGAYRIKLNTPWTGPTIPAGSAVRNATGVARYNEVETSGAFDADQLAETGRVYNAKSDRLESVEYTSTIGGGVWQDGLEDSQRFRPGTAFIQPVFQALESVEIASCDYLAPCAYHNLAAPGWDDVVIQPEHDVFHAGPVPITFNGQRTLTVAEDGAFVSADRLLPVDPTETYRLSLEAVIGDDLVGSTTAQNIHTLGFESYDVEGNELMPPAITPLLLDGGVIPDVWTTYAAEITSFRPGTAYIRPVLLLNQDAGASSDTVSVRGAFVEKVDLASPELYRDGANRAALNIDVLAKDWFSGATTVEILSVAAPAYGAADILPGAGPGGRDVIRYVSPSWFVGAESFSYTVRNTATGATVTAKLVVEVLGGNEQADSVLAASLSAQSQQLAGNAPPLGNPGRETNDVYLVLAGEALTANGFAARNLLDDDDDPSDILAARLIDAPTYGTLLFHADGTFVYAPRDGFHGTDSFRYAAFDGLHETEVSVLISVVSSPQQLVERRLEAIGSAMYDFHDRYNKLPVTRQNPTHFDASGNPYLSWRVHLLPFLGWQSLYDQFHLNEPWDSVHNLPLMDKMPDVFRQVGDSPTSIATRFQIISGEGSEYYFRRDANGRRIGPALRDFTDDLKHSILVIESGADSAVAWTKPDDLAFDPANPLAALANTSSGIIRAVMADGRVLTISSTIDPATFKALVTIAGGELLDVDTLRREYAEQHGGIGSVLSWARAEQEPFARQLAVGFHNFHDTYQQFPVGRVPAYFAADGNPLVSWRVHLLPFLGYQNLYDAFNVDEPWDSPNNLPLLARMPDIFRAAGDAADSTTTRIMTFNGPDAAFGSEPSGSDQIGPSFRDYWDGTSNTILFAEAGSDQAVPWTRPDDILFDIHDPFLALGELTSGELRFALADGTVATLAADISPAQLSALVTPRGDATTRPEESQGAYQVIERERLRRGHAALPTDTTKALKSIAIALHNHHDMFGRFPVRESAELFDAQGLPYLSWRVHILPFIEGQQLYEQFHLDEPWDSPHNLSLLDQMPDYFRSAGDPWDSTTTRMATFTGPGAPFLSQPPGVGDQRGPRILDFTDGTSNTILVTEAGPEAAVPWTKPTDVPFWMNNPFSVLGELGAAFSLATADGAVRVFSTNMSTSELNARITHRGGEAISNPPAVANLPDFTIIESGGDTKFYELGADEFYIVLDQAPRANVVINVASSGQLLLDHSQLIFTPQNWNLPQRIGLRYQDNFIVDGDKTRNILVQVDASRSDDAFDLLPTKQVVATVLDDEMNSRLTITTTASSIVENAGLAAAQGTVMRSATDITQPLTVTLSSSDPARLRVPIAVTIAANATSATFAIDAIDNDLLDGTDPVLIIASAAGFLLDTATVTVADYETLTVVIDAAAIPENGGSTTATVRRGNIDDLTQSLTISLSSSDTSEAVVPTTVTIPAHQDATTFSITGVDDSLLDGTQSVTITASATGYVAGMDTLNVTDHETITLSITAAAISEDGGSSVATVTRSNVDTTQPLSITLASSDASEAVVPASVTILANQASASFTVTAVDDGVLDGTQTVSITAAAANYFGGADTVDVVDHEVLTLSITAATLSENGGETTATITRGNTDLTQPLIVSVTSSDTSEAIVPATVTIPANLASVTFDVTAADDQLLDGTQSVTLTASAAGYVPATSTVDVLDHETLTMTIADASIREDGGFSTATVTRTNTDIAQALTVALTSSDPSEARVPAMVTIPANASSATFSIIAVDDSFLDGTQTVTIAVAAAGYVGAASTLDVTDHETLTLSIAAAMISESGGATTATVTRSNTDMAQPLIVSLTSSDTSKAIVPTTVTIPANQASVTFDVTAVDDQLLDGTQVITLTASAAGYVAATSTVDVLDHEILTLTIADASIREDGGISTATVTRTNTNIAQALTVALTSSDPSEAMVPAVVTISANATSATFSITAVDDNLLDGTQTVTITVSAAGYVNAASTLDVTDHETLTLAIAAAMISENEDATTATVTRNNTDLSQPLIVSLTSSDVSEATVPASVTIPANEASVTFEVTAVDDQLLDGTRNVTLTASAAGYLAGTSKVDVGDHETLTVTIANASIREDGGFSTATVTRTNTDIAQALTVTLASSDPSEAVVPITVTIPANESSVTFSITAVDDGLLDGTQTVTIAISAAGYVGAASTLDVTDHETLTLAIAAAMISESGGASTATVTRSNTDITQPLIVSLTSSDTSEAIVPTTVTIPVNQASVTFDVTAADDQLLDGTQGVTLTASAAGYLAGTGTVNVLDHEILTLTIADASIREDGGISTATVTRTNTDIAQPVTVTLTSSDPSEAMVPTVVTIPANASSAMFTITAVDDSLLDGTQTVTIGVSVAGYVGAASTLDVTDHETLTLSIAAAMIWENGGVTTATVARSNTDLTQPLIVSLTSSDTSEAIVPATVTIPANEASVTFEVTAADDQLLDGTQVVTLTASAAGYVAGTSALDVVDHETLTLTIADASIREDNGVSTATVTRGNTDIAQALTVTLTSSDPSEAMVPAVVTIPANASSATFAITAVDDSLLDGTQTVTIAVSAAGYVGAASTLDVTDHETLTLSITAATISENGGETTATVTRNNTDLTQPLIVSLTSSDTSEAIVPATVTIPANEASVTFDVTAADDQLLDGTQVVAMTASAAGYVPATSTLNVLDHETLTVTIADASICENCGASTATVTRGNTDIAQALTVTLTSSDPSEAMVPAVVTIPANASSATFSISAVDDSLLDGTQTVTIAVSAAGYVGAASTLDVTDHETITLSIAAATISENGGATTATVTRGNTDLTQPLIVTLTSSDTSEAIVPATVTIPANQAAVTFDVTAADDQLLDGTQSVTLTASAAGYVAATSEVDVLDHEILTLTIADVSVREDDGVSTATVTRGNTDIAQALTVTLTSSDPSEARVPAVVTIPANASSATFAITAVDDSLLDGTQTVTIAVSAAGYVGAASTLDVTDHETITLSILAATISENGGATTAKVTRGNTDLTQPLIVLLTSSDTSEAIVPATVTIPANQASVTFDVTAVDDQLLDGTQSVTVTVSAAGYVADTGTVDVIDYELLTLTIAQASIREDSGVSTATVTRGNTDIAQPVTVTLTSSDPSEAMVPAVVTIPANASSATFAITAADDSLLDGTQTVTIAVSAAGYVGAASTLDVTDHETISLSILAATISENGGATTATVARSNTDLTQPLTVSLTSSDMSEATVPAIVTIPANEASVTFDVAAVDDQLLDGTQSVTLTASAAGYLAGTSEVDVLDHEILTLTIADVSIREDDGVSTATVTRGNTDIAQALTVTLTSGDPSEAMVPAVVTIPANASSSTFTITAVDDSLLDGTQTVTIGVSAAGYVGAASTLDVTDHETLTLSIAAATISENGGATTATVTRGNTDLTQPLIVSLTSSDTSEAIVPATVTIPANQAAVTFDVTAADDQLLDGTQSVTLTASAAGYVAATSEVDVLDHEILTLTIADVSIREDSGISTATVTRTNTDIAQALTVALTSSDPSEAMVPAVITIPANASSATFSITAVDDSLLDGTQTVTIAVSAAGYVGAASTLDVTDHETLTLSILAATISENGGATTATVTRGNTDMTQPLIVLLTNSDTSEAIVPATVTIPANEASVTFDVTAADDQLLDGTQSVTLTASAAGYVAATSEVDVLDHEILTLTIADVSIREDDGVSTATVTRGNTDIAQALTVTLTSSDPSEAMVPAVVTIPSNASSATFAITAADDSLLDGTQTVTIAVSAAGYVGAASTLDVTDHETLTLSILAATISENGGATTATVTRGNTDLTQPLVVSLSSSDTSEVTVPATIQIPANQPSAEFSIAAADDDVLDGTQTVTITAMASGYAGGAGTLEIVDHETLSLSLSAAAIVEDHGTATLTVQRDNADIGEPLTVVLTSSDPGEALVPSTLTIPAGAATASVLIAAQPDDEEDGTQTVFVTAAAPGYVAGRASIEVVDNPYPWHNRRRAGDVNADGRVSPVDALMIVNDLNTKGARALVMGGGPPFLDVSRDNAVSPIDALLVVNFLNAPRVSSEPEASPPAAAAPADTPISPDPDLLHHLAAADLRVRFARREPLASGDRSTVAQWPQPPVAIRNGSPSRPLRPPYRDPASDAARLEDTLAVLAEDIATFWSRP